MRARISLPGKLDIWLCVGVISLALASYIANVFAKWLDYYPHTLPLLEIVLAAVALTLAIFALSRLLATVLLLVQVPRSR